MAVFRVEKTRDYTVMSNHHLRNTALSLKGKGMMSLMLSLPENWDFTTKGLASICKDGVDSISATLRELEQHGYLTRERQRDTLGRMGEIIYTIHEQPVQPEKPVETAFPPKRDFPVQVNPSQVNPRQAHPILEKPSQLSTKESSTKKSITHESNIYPINPADAKDEMDEREEYRQFILENIEYEHMLGRYDRARLDEVVELILEVVCSKRPYIRVAGDEIPKEVVGSRLLKLDSTHIEYAFDCIDKNTTKVRNVKSYLLTTLYNAPATMDTYYRAEVNHDFHGGSGGGDW